MLANQRDLHQNDKYIWVPAIICGFVYEKQRLWSSNTSLYGSQTSSVVLSTHNSVCSTRLSRPYGFQPSPSVLCMQNRDFRTRITGLCVSKTPPVLFACKTTTSGPEWQVSMGPRHDLSFCACTTACLASELLVSVSQPSSVAFACKTATFGPELQVSMGPRPHLWFCACKTVCLASELLVSMGPSPHLCLLHVKQRLLDQNNKSLMVPDKTFRIGHVKRRA